MTVKTKDAILESIRSGNSTRPPFEDFDLMSKYLEKNKFFDRIPDSYIRIDRTTMRCMIDLGRPSWLVSPIRIKKYIYLCDGKSRFGYIEYDSNTHEIKDAEFMTEVEPSSYGRCHWEYTWTEDSAIRGMTKMVADIVNMKTESEYSNLSEYVCESIRRGGGRKMLVEIGMSYSDVKKAIEEVKIPESTDSPFDLVRNLEHGKRAAVYFPHTIWLCSGDRTGFNMSFKGGRLKSVVRQDYTGNWASLEVTDSYKTTNDFLDEMNKTFF